MATKVTIQDIANELQLSRNTVSKAIRSQETADCQQDKPEFCGGLKIFPERLKKHPGQTIVPIFRHFERDVEQCGRRSPYGNDGQAAHEP